MSVRVQINAKAVDELLKQAAMPELKRRGQKIADAANGGQADDFETQEWVGRNRARVTVRTKTFRGRYREAKYRTLTRALDAGRG